MTRRIRRFALSLAVAAAVTGTLASGLFAADKAATPEKKPEAKKPEAKKPEAKKAGKPRYAEMDYGPFLTASFVCDPRAKFDNGPGSFTGDCVARGLIVKLEDDWNSGLVFDMDLMRVTAGWTGGPIQLKGVIGDGGHGWDPMPSLPPVFQAPHLPGWADKAGSFKDPRPAKIDPLPPAGPLPKEHAHYNGLYRHGEKVLVSYTVGGANVLETFGLEKSGETKAFVRTIRVEKSDAPLSVMIADVNPQYPYPGAKKITNIEEKPAGYQPKTSVSGATADIDDLHVALVGAPDGAKLEVVDGSQLVARLPQTAQSVEFKTLIAGGGDKSKDDFAAIVKASPKPEDLTALTKGGPSLWKQTIETKGELAKDESAPYVVDALTIPYDNPYKSWMRIGAFDFFPDGKSAALSTWSGDVWIVSRIDQGLEHLTWKRFATGLHQPLGLKVVDNTVYTVGHDQITRLKDLDGDGEADLYENFNNNWQLTSAFHAFAFDLQTDPEGNFYFAFGSPVHAGGGGFQKITDDHGTLFKVSKDGSTIEHYARGLRAPNGMCVGPHGEVTCGDNEGSWVPASPLHWVKKGQFLGVAESADVPLDSSKGKLNPAETPKPLLWLSHNGGVDNSCGGQVWVTSDKWGPFAGDLLHTSYGQSRLFKVMKEEVNGQMQGGAVAFPVKFTSSAMRARFSPLDGQLYITGLKGWQTNAAKDGGFDRVRYTGKPVYMPKDLHATEKGLLVTFTEPLSDKSATDPGNYSVETWNYKWTSGYGSREYSVANPEKQGHDALEVKSARLLPDGKTVFLEIDGIKPAMQMKVDYNVDAKDKPGVKGTIYNTIHNLAPAPIADAGQK